MVAWVCWLLLQYYREWISLRQSYERQLAQAADSEALLGIIRVCECTNGRGVGWGVREDGCVGVAHLLYY